MVKLYDSGPARRGDRRGVESGRRLPREKCFLLFKVYPVLLKVFRWLYKVTLLPKFPTDQVTSEYGISSKLLATTTLRLLRSSKASRRSSRSFRVVRRLRPSNRPPCG